LGGVVGINMICIYLYILYMLYTCVFVFFVRVISGLRTVALQYSRTVTHCIT